MWYLIVSIPDLCNLITLTGKVGVFSLSGNMKFLFTDVMSFILQNGNFKILVRTSCEQKRF